MNAIKLYRVARWLYQHHVPLLPRLLQGLIFFLYNSHVPYTADIGAGTRLAYGGMGVVIHSQAKIGRDCIIGQQVTIGGRSRQPGVPRIGNKVYLAGGSKILGDLEIGDDVVIGANAVVIESLPSHCVAAGVPARIIRTGTRYEDYV